MKRQKIRRLTLFVSFLFFPVTLYYFSPALIINAGLKGIVNGSFIVFASMIVLSIFFGRFFCAYLCPAGGLQDCAALIVDRKPKQGRKNFIKFGIWIVWICAVIFCYAGKIRELKIDFFYQTDHGISASDFQSYVIYYGIVLLILLSALIAGRRAFCHYFCWMAPFLIFGTKIRGLLHLPGLRISVDGTKCVSCNECAGICPMCIEPAKTAPDSGRSDPECIQCGACADICKQKAITYRMRKGSR